MKIQFQLLPTNFNNIPFQIYENDFEFIINDEEFRTSRIVADLLSPIICQIHITDPSFDTFIINTQEFGNFTHILQLVNFEIHEIPEKELPFFIEVIEKLGNSNIKLQTNINNTEITTENVFTLIKIHELSKIYSECFEHDIELICAHFYELCETKLDEFMNMNVNTIIRIINDKNLHLKSEDQLLNFVNILYSKNTIFSILYESIYFLNVSPESMNEFLSIFNNNDMNGEIWNKLSQRLRVKINQSNDNIAINEERYNTKIKFCQFTEGKEFSGILDHLRKKSYGKIENKVKITGSSFYSDFDGNNPYNVTLFNDDNKYFFSADAKDSWICFDFIKHRVIPKNYSIKTVGKYYPKNWVIEVSNDNISWLIVDTQNDCPFLNGRHFIHTFNIINQQSNSYRYLRMRQTGETWSGYHYFLINSFEIYGYLV